MKDIHSSHLYQLLQFWRKFSNGFSNINEIYFFVYGYTCVFHSPNITNIVNEDWINDFFLFINQRLREKFYPDRELRSCHFGLIINEYFDDPIKGIEFFYNILDEFVNEYNKL